MSWRTPTDDERDQAISDCKLNGENPYGWLDYADLRNQKYKYEYFLPSDCGGIDDAEH